MTTATRCLVLAALLLFARPAAAFEPTARYKPHKSYGFTILVSPQAMEHPREADHAIAMIESQLRRLTDAVPEKPLAVLKKTRIWVEWDVSDAAPTGVVARFFPGDGYVTKHGMNPDKANGVEVLRAKRFTSATQDGLSDVVIHELAHAYHHHMTDRLGGKIEATYKQAVERRLYDDVEHRNGARGRAYAVLNDKEYFATLSEAYFGKSFNFPYDRAGLLRYDTTGYWLMESCWGKPR